MFFNQYPYLNLNDLNLDYVLKTLKSLSEQLENFISLNTIKYANPIQWNITTQYEANTVVIDPNNGTAYLSVQPVPTGVAITNTDYWTPIFTLNLLSANQNITLRDDGANVLATFKSSVGDWLIWNNTLYKVTRDIAVNESYVVGYNLVRYSVELFIHDYINSVISKIGSLDDLETSDKTAVVNAINEIYERLAEIDTYYVMPEDFGAVGDGVTDDTAAFEAALSGGKIVKCKPNKTYKFNGVVDLSAEERIFLDGNNSKFIGASFQINTTEDSDRWIQAYAWRSRIKNCYFIADGTEVAIHIGGGLLIEDCIADDYDHFILFTNNYIDDCQVFRVGFRNYRRGDASKARIQHPGLGDNIRLENIHCTGAADHLAKYVFYGPYITGIMINCIASGIDLGAQSTIDIISCLFPLSGKAKINVQSSTSIVTCKNCTFVGTQYIFDNVKYINCTFKETFVGGGKNGTDIETLIKQCESCLVGCSWTASSAGIRSAFNTDLIAKTKDFNYYIGDGITITGISSITGDGVPGVPESGTYTYYVVPSMYYDRILRNHNAYFSNGSIITANAGDCVRITTSSELRNAFKHVYRVTPSGTIQHAVVPPMISSISGSYAGYLLDNGLMCGITWETVSELPTLTLNNLTMKNGIVSAFNANLPDGALYIDTVNDNAIKQK